MHNVDVGLSCKVRFQRSYEIGFAPRELQVSGPRLGWIHVLNGLPMRVYGLGEGCIFGGSCSGLSTE